MRVIAGTSRGRAIRAPQFEWLRPTSDRVREAIFDVLVSMIDLEGASVVDLFAGSGALGIEALSRGANEAVFVDREARSLSAITANLRSTGLEDARADLVRAEVLTWLRRRAGDSPEAVPQALPFDLALVDPPYAFAGWEKLLELLDAKVAVLESDRPVDPPASFNVVKTKRYGSTLVTVVRAAGANLK